MLIKICLLASVLPISQAVGSEDNKLAPRLVRGQELVYSGSYTQESLAPGVSFRRHYRIQTRAVVLNTTAKGWQVAFLTGLRQHNMRLGAASNKLNFTSVKLRVLEIDKRGKRLNGDPGLNLDGPPTVETGCIVTVPSGRLDKNSQWLVMEPGRPTLNWRVAGNDVVGSTRCVKLEGRQESADWKNPRADSTAWKRTEHVWVSPQTGAVYRVQRVVEHREPARIKPTQRSKLVYELDRNWIYPARLFSAQSQEFLRIAKFDRESEKYIQNPNRNKSQLRGLLRRIDLYLQSNLSRLPKSALRQIKHRIEAVQRGKVVVVSKMKPAAFSLTVEEGKRVPDFLVTDLLTRTSIRLHSRFGRPILIVFYDPKSTNSRIAIRFAGGLKRKHGKKLDVLAMAVRGDVSLIKRQSKDLELSFPILDGRGLHRTFGVDGTPRLILIDRHGMVRLAQTGWGVQTAREIETALQRAFR